MTTLLSIILLLLLNASSLFALDISTTTINTDTDNLDSFNLNLPLPVYVTHLSNINDFVLFANGGWDANWYVGFNLCWMKKLPPIPPGDYRHAFIGAKLGRMKTRPIYGKPIWEKEPIPGEIYMAISSTPAWKSTMDCFLTDTIDIPLDGDSENALEGVGQSRWFWTEVSTSAINFGGDNFLALWSPTRYFISTSSSPILAGGLGNRETNAWMNNDVRGYPPINPATSLKTGISAFEPAMALKLIPVGTEQQIKISIIPIHKNTYALRILGNEIEKACLEISTDDVNWKKIVKNKYGPPYIFTIKEDSMPQGSFKLRAIVTDVWENTGISDVMELNFGI